MLKISPHFESVNLSKQSPQDTRLSDPDPIVAEIVDIMTQDVHNQSSPLKKRGQHPKSHGCLYGELSVNPDIIPEDLREDLSVGLLRQAKTYPSWIRFSNLRQTNDAKGDIHGMALKLMDVEGEQLETESEAMTQDFALIDVPIFFITGKEAYRDMFRAIASLKQFFRMKQNPIGFKTFIYRLHTLGRTTHQFRQFLMPSLRPGQWRFRSIGILVREMRKKKRHKPSTLLDQTFWSPTPIQWGNRMVKVMVKPWEMNQSPKVRFNPNYLREQLLERLTHQRQPARFDIYLQVDPYQLNETTHESWQDAAQANPDLAARMNDATLQWKEAKTVKIGTLDIHPQEFDRPNQRAFSEQLSFSPWHGLSEHQPLGELNQIRQAVYREVAKLRSEKNHGSMKAFGFEAGHEPTSNTFSPTLLEAAIPTEQTALTVLAPIQPDQVNELRYQLEKVSTAIAADASNFFGRSLKTHLSRFVILEDPDLDIDPVLLFTSNFDGPLEAYLEDLVQVIGAEMEPIWRCCQNYPAGASSNFDYFRDFIQDHSFPAQTFYVGCRGVTVQDILNGHQLRQTLDAQMQADPALRKSWINLTDLSPTLPLRGDDKVKMPTLIRVARRLGKLVWKLIGVSPRQNEPETREHFTSIAIERMANCSIGEDHPQRIQNQLTTLSEVKSDFHLFMLRHVLKLVHAVGKLSRGTLSGIDSIHFARWVIIEKGIFSSNRAYLLFTTNFSDTWDGYLDDFVYLTITAMNSIWANLMNYPINGCQDIERFKQHSKSRQFPAQVFYSAYPDLNVKNIISDRNLGLAVKQVGQFLQGDYCALHDVEDHPFMKFVKRVNRME